MHQVQIEVLRAKVLQCLVQSRLDIFGSVLGIPQLAGYEYVSTRNSARLDTRADFGLVAVYGGAVDLAITASECMFHRLLDLVRLGLPCAKTHGRDGGAGVEGELGRKWHVVGLVDQVLLLCPTD